MIQLQNQLVLSHWSPNSSTGQSVLILTHGPCTFNNLCVSYYLLAAGNSFLPCLSLKGHCNCCSAKLQPRCRKRKSSWAPNIPLKEIAWSFPSGNQNAGFLKHLDKWRCYVFRRVKEVMDSVNVPLQYHKISYWLQLFHCKSWMARLYTALFFSLTVPWAVMWGTNVWDLTLCSLLNRKSNRNNPTETLPKLRILGWISKSWACCC